MFGDSPGVRGDEANREKNLELVAENSKLMICGRCGGTGNEFYWMYKRCLACKGIGTLRKAKKA